jgi:hypothetical protein
MQKDKKKTWNSEGKKILMITLKIAIITHRIYAIICEKFGLSVQGNDGICTTRMLLQK